MYWHVLMPCPLHCFLVWVFCLYVIISPQSITDRLRDKVTDGIHASTLGQPWSQGSREVRASVHITYVCTNLWARYLPTSPMGLRFKHAVRGPWFDHTTTESWGQPFQMSVMHGYRICFGTGFKPVRSKHLITAPPVCSQRASPFQRASLCRIGRWATC